MKSTVDESDGRVRLIVEHDSDIGIIQREADEADGGPGDLRCESALLFRPRVVPTAKQASVPASPFLSSIARQSDT
jgi:hypothetical protein